MCCWVFAYVLQKYWHKIVIEDPNWRPHPEFRVEGGFDYGKTNPTALLRAYIDFDGTVIYAGEYYQPGLGDLGARKSDQKNG